MRLWAFGAIAALALAAPSMANAAGHDIVGEFNALCLESNASPASALARADATGWTAPEAPDDVEPGLRVLRQKQDDAGKRLLVMGTADAHLGEDGPYPARMCEMTYLGAAPPDAQAELEAHIGLKPMTTTKAGDAIYLWAVDGDQRKTFGAGQDDEARKAFHEGKGRIVSIRVTDDRVVLIYQAAVAPTSNQAP